MGSLLFDLRHAVRALISSPVFTAVTVVTLALGIGANSAIFSLVNAVLLRPLGYQDPERLMMIHEIIPESRVPRFGVSPADYLDLDQYQASFTDIGVYRTRTMELSGSGDPEEHQRGADSPPRCSRCSASNAADGRTFLPEEDQSEQSVAVISEALRRRRFAASIAGRRADHARSPAVHDRRRDAGGLRVPEARAAVQRRARGRLSAARVQSVRAAGPRHVLQPQRDRPAEGRRDDGAGDARHGGAGAAHRENYPAPLRNSP